MGNCCATEELGPRKTHRNQPDAHPISAGQRIHNKHDVDSSSFFSDTSTDKSKYANNLVFYESKTNSREASIILSNRSRNASPDPISRKNNKSTRPSRAASPTRDIARSPRSKNISPTHRGQFPITQVSTPDTSTSPSESTAIPIPKEVSPIIHHPNPTSSPSPHSPQPNLFNISTFTAPRRQLGRAAEGDFLNVIFKAIKRVTTPPPGSPAMSPEPVSKRSNSFHEFKEDRPNSRILQESIQDTSKFKKYNMGFEKPLLNEFRQSRDRILNKHND